MKFRSSAQPDLRITLSWHGQAEQPMMLRGRSVLAGVPDAQGTQPWTRVARSGVVCSCVAAVDV
eukprot:scaffold3597_cov33-Phaeocystis_antarctica.AAC.1